MKHQYIILFKEIHAREINILCNILHILPINEYLLQNLLR